MQFLSCINSARILAIFATHLLWRLKMLVLFEWRQFYINLSVTGESWDDENMLSVNSLGEIRWLRSYFVETLNKKASIYACLGYFGESSFYRVLLSDCMTCVYIPGVPKTTVKEPCLIFIKTRVPFHVPVLRMNTGPRSTVLTVASSLPLILVSSLLQQASRYTEITLFI